mgnify:CR=1 FL=1
MEEMLIQLFREALYLVLLVSAPPVLASMFIGLLVSVFQATTSIQEQTLTFVPKLIGVFGSLVIAGPWIGQQLVRFTRILFETIAMVS